MKIGDRVTIRDTDFPPGSEYSCDGVTGTVILIEADGAFELAHDDPWRHMDLNLYRADMAGAGDE